MCCFAPESRLKPRPPDARQGICQPQCNTMAKLTKTLIDNTPAPAKGDTWIWDAEVEGFGVRIQAGGRKTYVVRYRTRDAARTQRKLTLGRCSDLAPDRARDQARKIFTQVADGQDPAAERKPTKPKEITATVERMFQGYVASMRVRNRASADEVERVLLLAKNSAANALGRHRAAAEVEPIDVVNFVAGFYQAGHRGAADKARSYIASAFAWALKSANDYTATERQDWGLTRNPAADVAKDQGATQARDRNLSAAELRTLWESASDGNGGFGLEIESLIKILICCGQRVQETLLLEGAEIDLAAALWRMPAHKTKGRKHTHTVPLPKQALPVLRRLIERHGDGPLFPARSDSQIEVIQLRSVSHAVRRFLETDGVKMEPWQPRDLRRTWKSRAHDAGVDRYTRDLIQQHARSDTGSKHYDRAEYFPQMQAAMAKWSDWLEGVLFDKPDLTLIKSA